MLRGGAPFPGSERYWNSRYSAGGTSGSGSYGKLAEFKAEIINTFVQQHAIERVIEFGCGDGNQLRYARYPSYLGFDISPDAIARCRALFAGDASKEFRLVRDYDGERAPITMSLDVIYHLTEDDVFDGYMSRLFDASDRFVIIYSTDQEQQAAPPSHVRHRQFTRWVAAQRPSWSLVQRLRNRYENVAVEAGGSPAEFFIFERGRAPGGTPATA